jgi:hypothetical protein
MMMTVTMVVVSLTTFTNKTEDNRAAPTPVIMNLHHLEETIGTDHSVSS